MRQNDIEAFALVMDAQTEVFSELVDLSGLDPSTDFQGVDLSGIDFKESDLREFRFRGSRLDFCDLSSAMTSSRTLDGVISIFGTRLPALHHPDRLVPQTVVSMRINRRVKSRSINYFGSLRKAATAAVQGAQSSAKNDVLSALTSAFLDGDRIDEWSAKPSHITLLRSDAIYLREIREITKLPVTSILRAMLKLANTSINPALKTEFANIHDKDALERVLITMRRRAMELMPPVHSDQPELPF